MRKAGPSLRAAGIVVAVDGPAGAGKSSVCRAVADHLGLLYVDTGAMYRAVAYALRGRRQLLGQDGRLADALAALRVDLQRPRGGGPLRVKLNGRDVTREVRAPEIGELASLVSRHVLVRKRLVALQRSLAYHPGIIMEGRDIGSVVFPDADVKVYLTASVRERARRRAEDLAFQGRRVPLRAIEREIRRRDRRDRSRKVSPLRVASGAIRLDTSRMTEAQVVEALGRLVRKRLKARSDLLQ